VHLKVNRVHNKGKSYEYVRLVQGIRGPDGRPTHKVLATLEAMDPQMIENLRTALQSGRHGKPVVLCEQEQVIRRVPILPEANLAYLDVIPKIQAPLIRRNIIGGHENKNRLDHRRLIDRNLRNRLGRKQERSFQ